MHVNTLIVADIFIDTHFAADSVNDEILIRKLIINYSVDAVFMYKAFAEEQWAVVIFKAFAEEQLAVFLAA